MTELGPDEERGEIVEEEVVGESLTEPGDVDQGDCNAEHGEDGGAVPPHDAVGLPPVRAELGQVKESTANEGDLDKEEEDVSLVSLIVLHTLHDQLNECSGLSVSFLEMSLSRNTLDIQLLHCDDIFRQLGEGSVEDAGEEDLFVRMLKSEVLSEELINLGKHGLHLVIWMQV